MKAEEGITSLLAFTAHSDLLYPFRQDISKKPFFSDDHLRTDDDAESNFLSILL